MSLDKCMIDMDDSILPKFPDDDHALGPFLGHLPGQHIIIEKVIRQGSFKTTFLRSRSAQFSPMCPGRVLGGAVLAVLLSADGANAASVFVGRSHACAVLNDGKLMCWGSNSDGQIGVGVTGGHTSTPLNVDLGLGRTARAVACGAGHTCAILDDDTLKCWGQNDDDGRLGYGDTTSRNAPEATTVVDTRLWAHSEGCFSRVHEHLRHPRQRQC